MWISSDKRYVVVSVPGHLAGTGTPMGEASYYRTETRHMLFDRTAFAPSPDGTRRSIGSRYYLKEASGRLTKEKLQDLISAIPAKE